MKDKTVNFLGFMIWIAVFILLIKVGELENKFWLGLFAGILISLTIIGLIKVIYDQKKNNK